jgi:PAS domain S-box-containing protein
MVALVGLAGLGAGLFFTTRLVRQTRAVGENARAELDRFFSLSLDLLCIASAQQGHFTRVNPAWETTLGWTTEELTTRPFLDFVHPDDISKTLAAVEQQMVRGEAVLSFVNRYRCRDGSYRWLQWKSAPRPVDGLMYAAARDVTADRAASLALERHARQLTVLNRELEAFSYSVSHDLRAPLRAIDGFSQALLDDCAGQLDETGRGHLHRVRQATQRMGALIDDLLNLARVTRADLEVIPVSLSALAAEVARELSATDPARVVDWQIEPNIWAHGDARLLRIALENLFSNAWKFTAKREHTRIEFQTVDQHGMRAYRVRDNGAGFDPAHAGKLFGTFQRLHTDREFPGNGVGLATVQRIIHRHGGALSAAGTVDGGAAFTFTLAASDAAGAAGSFGETAGRQVE